MSHLSTNLSDQVDHTSKFRMHSYGLGEKKVVGDLLMEAAKEAQGKQRRVAICGEGVHSLFASDNLDATITLERLWNEMAKLHELDILCAYFRSDFAAAENISTLERICAEHSAVHGW